jgi:hypothetical protein
MKKSKKKSLQRFLQSFGVIATAAAALTWFDRP